MDALGTAKVTKLPPAGPPIEYSSLLVASEELAVLMPSYDGEFIGALNSIYNNRPDYKETRRASSVKELSIPFPQLNILAGTQPGWLASTFPEEAWSTGLASRMMMIYSESAPLKDLFLVQERDLGARKRLLSRLSSLTRAFGPVAWTPEAAREINAWHLAGGKPEPSHSKLVHYVRRRTQHCQKLAMIATLARGDDMQITLPDLHRAWDWMFAAEVLMPDIFRAMLGKSDTQVIEELHSFLTSTWAMGGKKGVPERTLVAFLSQRVPSEKIARIMEVAERGGYMEQLAVPGTFKPRPKFGKEVE